MKRATLRSIKKGMSAALAACLLIVEQGAALSALAADRASTGKVGGVPAIAAGAMPASLGSPLSTSGGQALPGAAAPVSVSAAVPASPAGVPSLPQTASPAASGSGAAPTGPSAPEPETPRARGPLASGISRLLGVLPPVRKWRERRAALQQAFDNARVPADGIGEVPSGEIAATLILAGHAPVRTTLERLPAALEQNGFRRAFVKNGHVALVRAERNPRPDLSEKDIENAGLYIKSLGLPVRVAGREKAKEGEQGALVLKNFRASTIAVDWDGKKAQEAAAAQRTPWVKPLLIKTAQVAAIGGLYLAAPGVGSLFTALFVGVLGANAVSLVREGFYSIKTLRAAIKESKRPSWNEIAIGFAGKVLPLLGSLGAMVAAYTGHPVALAFAMGLNFGVNIFHGIWADGWNTFQGKIAAQRGPAYQGLFNLIYGQLIGASFRMIAYLTPKPGETRASPPWSADYWRANAAMVLIGTFFGTLGVRSLNSLYEKRALPRWGRSTIQQLRDVFLTVVGTFFGVRNMFMTVLLFSIGQALDLALFLIDSRVKTRPIIVLSRANVADSREFAETYVAAPSPMKQTVEALKDWIVVKPFLALWRALRKKPSKA